MILTIWKLAMFGWASGWMSRLVFEDIKQKAPAWRCCLDTAVALAAVILAMSAARALRIKQ